MNDILTILYKDVHINKIHYIFYALDQQAYDNMELRTKTDLQKYKMFLM
jgi:hypothetical protein